jgi:excisionase family DNA binding protein
MYRSEKMALETDQETQYLTRKEVAKLLGVNERTVDRLIKKGKLRVTKLGDSRNSLVKIHKDSLAQFLR